MMFFRLKLVLVRLDILQSPDTSLDNHKGKDYHLKLILNFLPFLFQKPSQILEKMEKNFWIILTCYHF